MLDWKDALSSIKESGSLPEDNSPMPEETPADDSHPLKKPLKVCIDKKGRNGKTATIIEGFEGSPEKLEALARQLKQKLGAGGSARGGEILIQGDRKADVISFLNTLGYKTKNG